MENERTEEAAETVRRVMELEGGAEDPYVRLMRSWVIRHSEVDEALRLLAGLDSADAVIQRMGLLHQLDPRDEVEQQAVDLLKRLPDGPEGDATVRTVSDTLIEHGLVSDASDCIGDRATERPSAQRCSRLEAPSPQPAGSRMRSERWKQPAAVANRLDSLT